MNSKTEKVLACAVTALTAAMLLGAINIPAHALVADPRIGTPAELKHTPEPTPAQLSQQMRGTGTAPPVSKTKPETNAAPRELPSGPEPQAVNAVLEGAKEKPQARTAPKPQGRSTAFVGLAITAAILGLICGGGMLAVRMGPKPPEADSSGEA